MQDQSGLMSMCDYGIPLVEQWLHAKMEGTRMAIEEIGFGAVPELTSGFAHS
jgi:hypothetical protein